MNAVVGQRSQPLRILLGSDYHCQPKLMQQALAWLPHCDAYVNCGDFCSQAGRKPKHHGSLGYNPRARDEVELLQTFLGQIDQMGKPWIFVPGNHDPSDVLLSTLSGSHGIVATESRLVAFLGLWVLLVPFTPPCGWNWTLRSAHLREWVPFYGELAQEISIDLLVSHAPPRGILDEGGRWYARKMPTLRPLMDAIRPRYYLCGHMHNDIGQQVAPNGTTVINVAQRNWILELDPNQAITMPPSTLKTCPVM